MNIGKWVKTPKQFFILGKEISSKCDKCGYELIGRYAVVTVQGICDEIPVVEYNLCEDCEDDLYKWVRGEE